MSRVQVLAALILLLPRLAFSAEVKVTGVKAVHRSGQTFVTWTDVAPGEAGAKYRYAVYRSEKPITQDNLAAAEKRVWGIFNNSCKLYAFAFNGRKDVDRLDPKRPNCVIEDEGQPLPEGSGLAVITPEKVGKRYYAVIATDMENNPLGKVVPGESATTEAIEETPAPIQPIKVWDGKKRKGKDAARFAPTGKQGLPLRLHLHASGGYEIAGKNPNGDYYLYFGPREWGWREGLPGVFTVEEQTGSLILAPVDAIIRPPEGSRWFQSFWFGHNCVPQWSEDKEPRAYPFQERRLEEILRWTVGKYGVETNRVYCFGWSMGAWGTSTFATPRREIFAAIYPNRPRTRQRALPSLVSRVGALNEKQIAKVMMDDGKTSYLQRMDMVRLASEHHGDLPFIGWNCGRRDGFATWEEQVDMVKAMTAGRHGFAFVWDNGGHQTSKPLMKKHILKWYPPEKFALNLSYPAFGNSSIDGNLGDGDPKDGDMEGGINLGFDWTDPVDEAGKWSSEISNKLAKEDMTVDVTPRRCQKFKPKPGEKLKWTSSTGGGGEVIADQWGLVTVEKLRINPGAATKLTIFR